MSRVLADPVGEAIAEGVRECYEGGIDPETWTSDSGYVVGDIIRNALERAGYAIRPKDSGIIAGPRHDPVNGEAA